MFDPRIFAYGVYGALNVCWRLRCETPLTIRNGLALAYSEGSQAKERGQDLRLYWRGRRNDREVQVTALHYSPRLRGDRVEFIHFAPGSSLRGSWRGWTLWHLVARERLVGLTPPKKDDDDETATEAYLAALDEALDAGYRSYDLVFSLFGQVADSRIEARCLEANAGRLRVAVQPFAGVNLRTVDSSGASMTAHDGPDNVQRHMAVRSPIDRLTHATKEGGLHHFLEFSKGSVFETQLRILNPRPWDLGLLSLWRREMNDGMLRFGALASVGRGRVSVQEETYEAWGSARALQNAGLPAEQWPTIDDLEDPLEGLWQGFLIPPATLSTFETALRYFLTGGDDVA